MKKIIFLFFSLTICLPTFSQKITFSEVEPIISSKCGSCHRPGDAAPFSLLTYSDITKRLATIKKVISSGYMPPWRADNHYRDFANDRSLTDQEKNILLSWIDDKAPKGKYVDNSSSQKNTLLETTGYNRKPDLTLKIDSSFNLTGDNKERFIVYKIPFELDKSHPIEAIEFYSNNKKIVHHINYGFYDVPDQSVDIYSGAKFINTTDDDQSSTQLREQSILKQKMVYYTGWIPGTSIENYPEKFGWTLPKRGVLLITAHYSPLAATENSIVGVNLFYRKDPIKRDVKVISLGSGGIGEKDINPPLFLLPNDVSKHTLRVQTQEDQSIIYVWPHMHFLGKSFTAYAVTPEKDTINLIHIPDWDFRWQELYKLKQLVKIPRGSVIHLDCVYDNTENNPNNPSTPPKPVFSFGDMNSKNEMMTLLLIYSTYKDGDEHTQLE